MNLTSITHGKVIEVVENGSAIQEGVQLTLVKQLPWMHYQGDNDDDSVFSTVFFTDGENFYSSHISKKGMESTEWTYPLDEEVDLDIIQKELLSDFGLTS